MVSKQKKIALFLILLMASLMVVHAFVQFLLQNCPQGSIAKVNYVMSQKLHTEISVWGASTARINFDTPMMSERLQMSSFNVGLDGTPFQQYEGLLREYISYSEPKLIVIAIDINGLGGRNSLYHGHAWLHYVNNENVFNAIRSIDKDLAIKSRFVPLYYLTTYDRRFLLRCLKWIYFSTDGEIELENNGFHPGPASWLGNKNRSYDEPFSVPVQRQIVDNIQKVIAEAVRKNIQVAVVVPPCYSEATKLINNRSEFEMALNLLEQKKVRVFNYLDIAMSFDSANFYNNTHLSAPGSSVFTTLFIEDIRDWLNE